MSKYYLIAGEASGDLHGGNLMRELRRQDADAEFRCIGGEQMEAAGGTLVRHYRELAYMGIIPVLLHLRTILRNMRMCKKDIEEWKPDVVILIDYPGFNLNIAKYVHSRRVCPVFYYISPKIWAWKEYRIRNIRRDVDELFSILPFEVEWFAKRNYPIHYVGNPSADEILSLPPDPTLRKKRQIAILAGSRRQEIKDNLGRMLTAASHFKDYSLVLAGAPSIELDYYRRYIPKGIDVEVRFGETYKILQESAAALVTSGTATLETAILRIPQVVCYYMRMGWLVSRLRHFVIHVPWISLVNLVAGRKIVEELVADRMTVENVRRSLADILPGGSGRERMLEDYEEMNHKLGGAGAARRAAEKMVQLLREKKDTLIIKS